MERECVYFFQSLAESLKHLLHVATFFHGDNTDVVLLIDPHKEGLLIVVPVDVQKVKGLETSCRVLFPNSS